MPTNALVILRNKQRGIMSDKITYTIQGLRRQQGMYMIYHQAQRQHLDIVEFRQHRVNCIKHKSILSIVKNIETASSSLVDVQTFPWGKFSFLILHNIFLYVTRGSHHADYLRVSHLACMARKAGFLAISLRIKEKAPTEAIIFRNENTVLY